MRNLIFAFILLGSTLCGANTLHAEPMTYEEIIKFEKPKQVLFSPNGDTLAFVSRQGVLSTNKNLETLYFYDIKSGVQEKIFAADEIKNIIWGNNDNCLYVLVIVDEVHKIISIKNGQLAILKESNEQIPFFCLSGNGSTIFYSIIKEISEDKRQERNDDGFVFDWEVDSIGTIAMVLKDKDEVWSLDLKSGQTQLITAISYSDSVSYYPAIDNILASEQGNFLLLTHSKLGKPDLGGTGFNFSSVIWDIQKSQGYRPLKSEIDNEFIQCWINDTQCIIMQASASDVDSWIKFWLVDAETGSAQHLEWLSIPDLVKGMQWDESTKTLYALSKQHIYKLSLEEQRIIGKIELPSLVENFSINLEGNNLSFIKEASNVPPEVALYDLNTNQCNVITSFNDQLKEKAIGHVEAITFKTPSGVESNGFLLHPCGEKSGQRYPLIIATYGFRGKFITDAEWHSSFPAQTLAGKGYFVLMLNHPFSDAQSMVNNPELAMKQEGWDCLELFEHAIDELVERGIADPSKVGVYGWSHGAFIVEFLIAHSQKFKVACLGEGGDNNPANFWGGGGRTWAQMCVNIFGGPPWGKTLKAYLEFSAFFNVEKVKTPLLMEYRSEACFQGFEFFVPLKYLGVPAEIVIYPNEEHNFVKPKARYASMARKTDWIDYWMFEKKDPNPKKIGQYQHWDHLRSIALERGKLN